MERRKMFDDDDNTGDYNTAGGDTYQMQQQ
jgi:hypothetical protein